MAEIALPDVVTAISNSTQEGFIAGTLYGQGWSVIFRALDAESLDSFIEKSASSVGEAILIYSPDLVGITPSEIERYRGAFRQVVGFSDEQERMHEFPGLVPMPKDESELLNLIRGSFRSPMIRRPASTHLQRRAKVVAIASPAGATGCTTIAINLAMETSILGKETLLIDGDVRSPSIAPLLKIHKLESDEFARAIATNLKVAEFTQEKTGKLIEFFENVVQNFDFVVIDLGSIEEISDSLTDRRWSATLTHWACERADEIIFVGKSDPLSLHRLKSLAFDLSKVAISARIGFLLNMQRSGRKPSVADAQFLEACSSLRPHRFLSTPRDAANLLKAEIDGATLVEVSDKSRLRKAIRAMAVELQT